MKFKTSHVQTAQLAERVLFCGRHGSIGTSSCLRKVAGCVLRAGIGLWIHFATVVQSFRHSSGLGSDPRLGIV